jgi:hypothetical protein
MVTIVIEHDIIKNIYFDATILYLKIKRHSEREFLFWEKIVPL